MTPQFNVPKPTLEPNNQTFLVQMQTAYQPEDCLSYKDDGVYGTASTHTFIIDKKLINALAKHESENRLQRFHKKRAETLLSAIDIDSKNDIGCFHFPLNTDSSYLLGAILSSGQAIVLNKNIEAAKKVKVLYANGGVHGAIFYYVDTYPVFSTEWYVR